MYIPESLTNFLKRILNQVSHTLSESKSVDILKGIFLSIQECYPKGDHTDLALFPDSKTFRKYPLLKLGNGEVINYIFLNNETLNIISNKVYNEKISNYVKSQYIIKQLCKFKILTYEIADIYYINPLILSLILNRESIFIDSLTERITRESLVLNEKKQKFTETLFPITNERKIYNQFILNAVFQIKYKTKIDIFQHMYTMIMYDVITKKYVFSGNDKAIEELAVKSNKSISTIRKTIAEFCKTNNFFKNQILYKTKTPGHYIINELFTQDLKTSFYEISLHFNISQNEISTFIKNAKE